MIILGSTGSIGQNTIDIARNFNIDIEMLVAGTNIQLLQQQIYEFQPKVVVVSNKELLSSIKSDHTLHLLYGEEGILKGLEICSSTLVLNALVGFLGLKPTIHSLKLGKKVALANKESLVVGGHLIDSKKIIPVDSEHFSLWFLLHSTQKPKELILTASGGALRDTPLHNIFFQKAHDALKHPNWSMGKKITIDSATMVNKLFEVLEAFWLFKEKNIQALIERSSTIHALVGFHDGSFKAHIAKNDMRLPIAYALAGKDIFEKPCKECDTLFHPISLTDIQNIHFEEIMLERYPIWGLKEQVLCNPLLGIIINACNEVAVEKFLKDEIYFGQIAQSIFAALEKFHIPPHSSMPIEEIINLDKEVRYFTQTSC